MISEGLVIELFVFAHETHETHESARYEEDFLSCDSCVSWALSYGRRKNLQSPESARETAREAARPAAARRSGRVSRRGLPRDPACAREEGGVARGVFRAGMFYRRKRNRAPRAG